jgi:ribosome-associated translation inhibitor RaiA
MMKINIQTLGNGNSKLLNQFVMKKLQALYTDNKSITEADVKLKTSVGDASDNKVCEIYLKVGDRNIFAVQKGSSFEECSLKAIKKLQGHVKKLSEPGQTGISDAT